MTTSMRALAQAGLFASVFIATHALACEVREESYFSKVLPAGANGPWQEHYLVVIPKGLEARRTYGAVYFLHGRDGDRHLIRDLGICNQLDSWVDRGGNPFLVIAPDGGNGYWMNGALTAERWGDVVTQELIAEVESKYPLRHEPAARVLAGISMGGHGAIQLSLNYPGIFGAIGAHSPVFRTQEEASKDFYYQFGTGIDYQRRDPFSLMMILGKRFSAPLYMDMGAQDPWLRNTQNFAQYVMQLGGPWKNEIHVAEDLQGGHAWGYWQYHLGSYVEWYGHHLP